MNITSSYFKHMKKHPDRLAAITADRAVTYIEWEQSVRKMAALFMKQPSVMKRAAVFLPNDLLFLQVFAGASMGGWANIVGDMRWTKREISERMEQTSPDLLIADRRMKDVLCDLPYKVIYSDELENLIKEQNPAERMPACQGPFYIGFTSGSTGKPKAFVRSHQSWVESFSCDQRDLNLSHSEQVLIPGSFTSSTFVYGAMSTLYSGGTAYILKKFSASGVKRVLENYPITVVYTVPTMIQALLSDSVEFDKQVTFISTGAKLLPHVKKQFRKQNPQVLLHEFYGASELSFVALLAQGAEEKYDASVGKPFHNVEVRIMKENGEEAGVNEEGTLYVRSKLVFDEYIHNPAETDKVKKGEWTTVHDLAKIDEDGYIYILGRKNDMILYGGYNIYPQEIERVLVCCDGVEEASVVGIRDEYWGEKAAAFVKGPVDLRTLKAYCREHLASYKIPRIWKKLDTLPKTSGGKISRRELKASLKTGSIL